MAPAAIQTRSEEPLSDKMLKTVRDIGAHFPGGFFVYEAAAPERLLYANDVVFEIFGCSNLEEFRELTGCTFKGMVHPDDYALKTKSIEAQIAFTHNQMDHVIYRIIRRDGQIRWIDDYGHFAETDEHGGIYYVFISDITETRLRMEKNQAVHTAVIDGLSNSYETVLLITDVQGESVVLYRATEKTPVSYLSKTLGLTRYSLVMDDYIRTFVAPEDRERVREQVCLENIIADTAFKRQYDVSYLRICDDQNRYYRVEFIRIQMPNGKTGIICGFKNVDFDVRSQQLLQEKLRKAIDENMRQEEELSRAYESAMIDYLTGVKNKRCFAMSRRQVNRNIADGLIAGYAIVFCDINDLKKVNDMWGHMIGDRYIKESSATICRIFQHSPVFRLGGDEFAVILTGQDFDSRHALMAQLSEQIRETAEAGGVSLACGMAEYVPGQDVDISSVIDRADRLMYENKRMLKEQPHALPAAYLPKSADPQA